MNRSMLILMTGLLLLAGVADVAAQPNETGDAADEDSFDYRPVLALVVLAAVVLAIAKYGP